jgi:hypothetical protein
LRPVTLEIPEPGATAYQNLMQQNPKSTRSRATKFRWSYKHSRISKIAGQPSHGGLFPKLESPGQKPPMADLKARGVIQLLHSALSRDYSLFKDRCREARLWWQVRKLEPNVGLMSASPSMRRPVGVKAFCGWVSSYLVSSLARILGDFVAGVAAVTESSEFILSLDGGRSQT